MELDVPTIIADSHLADGLFACAILESNLNELMPFRNRCLKSSGLSSRRITSPTLACTFSNVPLGMRKELFLGVSFLIFIPKKNKEEGIYQIDLVTNNILVPQTIKPH